MKPSPTDPYEVGDEEVIKREFDDYEMPAYDRNSLKEIRKKLDAKGYKLLKEITDHQEFLENMTNRLLEILQNEKNAGRVNWELERQIEEIKAMYFELEKLRKEKVDKLRKKESEK
jgi:predicted ATPase